MDVFNERLKNYSAGKVLDFGTGEGASVLAIIDAVKDFHEVIGVDTVNPQRKLAEGLLKNPRFRYIQHDGFPLPFESATFDTVSMSHVVHHLPPDLRLTALRELIRVLKPGGVFLFLEGYRDGQSGARKTQTYWHSLRAVMEQEDGLHHYLTLKRAELVEIINSLGFHDCEMFDFLQMWENFKDKSYVDEMAKFMDQDIETRRHLKRFKQYRRMVGLLKRRLTRTGYLRAKALVAICRKKTSTIPEHTPGNSLTSLSGRPR